MRKKTFKEPPHNVDSYVYTTTTRRGIAKRYIYRFLSDRYKVPVGIQFSTIKRDRIKISMGVLDKENRIIEPFDVLVQEVGDVAKTRLWCIEDFIENHPEYRKFRFV